MIAKVRPLRQIILCLMVVNVLSLGKLLLDAPSVKLDLASSLTKAKQTLDEWQIGETLSPTQKLTLRAHIDQAQHTSTFLIASGDRLQIGLFVLCCANLLAFGLLFALSPSSKAPPPPLDQ